MKRLLVVEDDPCIRDVLQECLTGEGYAVTVAATTQAAIHALERQLQDLIVTDGLEFRPPYATAQSQGFEALQRAAQGHPVVLYTGYFEAQRLNLQERHLAAVWLKPMGLDDLLAGIQALLVPEASAADGRLVAGSLRPPSMQAVAW